MALQIKTVQTGDYGWKSWSNAYVISLTLTEESIDVAANTSLVSYLFTISNTNNNRFNDANHNWSIFIGGTEIPIRNFRFDLTQNYTTQTIASGQVTVPHNPDGSLQMPYSVSVPEIQSRNRYGPPAMALTGTWELTPVPRLSTVSCPVGIIGRPVTLTVQKANEAYRHTITYLFGDAGGVIAEQTAQNEITWTIPSVLYAQIPGAKRGMGSLFCRTYNGNTLLGEQTYRFYADVDEAACAPTISVQVTDINEKTVALTGDENTLVRYYSNARITADCTARNFASVADFTMTHNGKLYKEKIMSLAGVESGAFGFSVTDSRGLTGTLQITKPVIPYVKLTCNLSNSKPDAEGNMPIRVSGNYFAGSFGKQDNSLVVQYRCKLSGTAWQDTEDEWHTIESELTETGYTAGGVITGLDYQKAHTVQARAVDRLATVKSTEYSARAIPVFDWGEKDFAIHGDLQVDGKFLMGDIPVLNTANVQTYYWKTEGGVSLQAVADFLATCKRDCGFLVMLQGTGYPFVGMAVGAVYGGGKYGAFTLYDCVNGVQSRRVHDGAFYEI